MIWGSLTLLPYTLVLILNCYCLVQALRASFPVSTGYRVFCWNGRTFRSFRLTLQRWNVVVSHLQFLPSGQPPFVKFKKLISRYPLGPLNTLIQGRGLPNFMKSVWRHRYLTVTSQTVQSRCRRLSPGVLCAPTQKIRRSMRETLLYTSISVFVDSWHWFLVSCVGLARAWIIQFIGGLYIGTSPTKQFFKYYLLGVRYTFSNRFWV